MQSLSPSALKPMIVLFIAVAMFLIDGTDALHGWLADDRAEAWLGAVAAALAVVLGWASQRL